MRDKRTPKDVCGEAILHTTIQDKQFTIRFSMCPCMYEMNFFFIDFFIGITCGSSIVYFVLFSFFIPFTRESVSPLDYKGQRFSNKP